MNEFTRWTALADVESVVHELWSRVNESRPWADKGASLALRQLNLIVLARGGRQAKRASSVLEALAAAFPARAVVMAEQMPGDRVEEPRELLHEAHPLARVTVRCGAPGTVGPPTCWEEMVVPVRREDASLLQSYAEPLLLSDLPVVLWIPQEPDCSAQDFRRLVDMADRVVLDSAAFDAPIRGLRLVADLVRETAGHRTVGDLSWARLTPWRELVADVFEDPARRDMLDRVETLTVGYGSEVVDSELAAGGEEQLSPAVARALLFCSWMASRLGWVLGGRGWHKEGDVSVLEMRRAGVKMTPGSTILFRLHPHRCLPGEFGGLETVTLEVAGKTSGAPGAVITIKRTPDSGVCSSRLRYEGREVDIRTIDMPLPTEEALLAEELSYVGSDTVFEESLAVAAQLSGLPGSEGLFI